MLTNSKIFAWSEDLVFRILDCCECQDRGPRLEARDASRLLCIGSHAHGAIDMKANAGFGDTSTVIHCRLSNMASIQDQLPGRNRGAPLSSSMTDHECHDCAPESDI